MLEEDMVSNPECQKELKHEDPKNKGRDEVELSMFFCPLTEREESGRMVGSPEWSTHIRNVGVITGVGAHAGLTVNATRKYYVRCVLLFILHHTSNYYLGFHFSFEIFFKNTLMLSIFLYDSGEWCNYIYKTLFIIF